jgi:hypothetical protein
MGIKERIDEGKGWIGRGMRVPREMENHSPKRDGLRSTGVNEHQSFTSWL